MSDRRRLARGPAFLMALVLVFGAASSRAQSVPVVLRASHPSPVSGAVMLTAEVPPDPGLLAVQFTLDGHVLDAPDTAHPYEVVWSAASARSGEHTMTAEAQYRSGAVITSAPLRLTVVNPATFNRTLHVDAASGNDAQDGVSAATAWRTLDKANRSVVAGDTVLLRGTFTGQHIRPTTSGTPAKPITFGSYPGQTAVLERGRDGVAVWLEGHGFIVVERLRIQNVRGHAVMFDAGAHHNVVRDSSLTGNTTTAIRITRSHDNLVEQSEILETGDERANAGDSVWIANGSSRNRIVNTTLRNAGHSLFQIGGDQPGDTAVLDNVVAGNTLSNAYTTALILSWMARRTLVEHSRISDAARNGVNYPRPGIQIQARDNVIRYNEVFNNAGAGLYLAAYTYGGSITQDAIGNRIYHNVFYANGASGLQVVEKDGRSVRDNLIANNIFFRNGGSRPDERTPTITIDHYHAPTAWPVGSLNGNRLANNVILRQPGRAGEPAVLRVRSTGQGGNLTFTLAQFQAIHREAADNLEVDPAFTDEAKRVFALRRGSPAVDRGSLIPGVTYSGSAPDIGAFEIDLERRSSSRP